MNTDKLMHHLERAAFEVMQCMSSDELEDLEVLLARITQKIYDYRKENKNVNA